MIFLLSYHRHLLFYHITSTPNTLFWHQQSHHTLMSFRWNLSHRQGDDRSFLLQGNELVATSIGITANRTALSCVMNIQDKDYKYFKEEAQILEAIASIYHKQKQWAFRAIQKATHYHKDVTNTIFLPEALNQGDYTVMSKFLEQLRTNRVGAYVKLNLQESKGYFQKAATLLKPATKMVRERLRYGFVGLKRNMLEDRSREEKKFILEDLDKISSIEKKESDGSDARKNKQNTISITYSFVDLTPSKGNTCKKESVTLTKSKSNSTNKTKARPLEIDIQQLLKEAHCKEYQFKNMDLSKVISTSTKIVPRHA